MSKEKKEKVLAHELIVAKLEELAKNIAGVLREGNSAAAYYGFPMVDCLCELLEQMSIPSSERIDVCLAVKVNARDRFTIGDDASRLFWNRLHTTMQLVLGDDVCGELSEKGGATVPLDPNPSK